MSSLIPAKQRARESPKYGGVQAPGLLSVADYYLLGEELRLDLGVQPEVRNWSLANANQSDPLDL